jgi:prevent-host-death family protein
MRQWQVQEAKARLSDLLREAQTSGPQESIVRGRPTAVILSFADCGCLRGAKLSFVDFMRASPLVGVELDLERDTSPMRDTEL